MKNKHTSTVPVSERAGVGLHNGTVRVVTEADIMNDPRLVGASAVVGQLYDFSNLPYIKDGVTEANVAALNKNHDKADEARVSKLDVLAANPAFTSEAERAQLGIATAEEVKATADSDEAARKRIAGETK